MMPGTNEITPAIAVQLARACSYVVLSYNPDLPVIRKMVFHNGALATPRRSTMYSFNASMKPCKCFKRASPRMQQTRKGLRLLTRSSRLARCSPHRGVTGRDFASQRKLTLRSKYHYLTSPRCDHAIGSLLLC